MLVCERMRRGARGPRLAQLVGGCLMLSIYLSGASMRFNRCSVDYRLYEVRYAARRMVSLAWPAHQHKSRAQYAPPTQTSCHTRPHKHGYNHKCCCAHLSQAMRQTGAEAGGTTSARLAQGSITRRRTARSKGRNRIGISVSSSAAGSIRQPCCLREVLRTCGACSKCSITNNRRSGGLISVSFRRFF